MESFALFDLDDTLTPGDSLIPFYFFGLSRAPLCALWLPVFPLILLLYLCKILPVELFKAVVYSPMSRMRPEDFAAFFEKKLRPRAIEATWALLEQHKKEGRRVLILSASPEPYVREFARRGLCDDILASPLRPLKNGRFSCLPAGKNCAGQEKVRRLGIYLQEHNLTINRADSYAYSDSLRDRPMLSLVDHPFLVVNDRDVVPFCDAKYN